MEIQSLQEFLHHAYGEESTYIGRRKLAKRSRQSEKHLNYFDNILDYFAETELCENSSNAVP